MKVINTWAVSLVRYAGGITEWKKARTKRLRVRTRTLLTMNGGFHSRACVTRLYVHTKDLEGGRGLISVEVCVTQSRILLERYVQSSEKELLKAVSSEDAENQETPGSFKARRISGNLQEWREKPSTTKWRSKKWRNVEGKLKREKGALIVAA